MAVLPWLYGGWVVMGSHSLETKVAGAMHRHGWLHMLLSIVCQESCGFRGSFTGYTGAPRSAGGGVGSQDMGQHGSLTLTPTPPPTFYVYIRIQNFRKVIWCISVKFGHFLL